MTKGSIAVLWLVLLSLWSLERHLIKGQTPLNAVKGSLFWATITVGAIAVALYKMGKIE